MRTGFPGILARTIPVPSDFVLDTSITSLPHASDPFENVLSFQSCVILLRGRYTILVRVDGWRNVIHRTRSGRRVICGFRRRCDSIRGHRDVIASDSELEYAYISLLRDMDHQLGHPGWDSGLLRVLRGEGKPSSLVVRLCSTPSHFDRSSSCTTPATPLTSAAPRVPAL
jgi:hypothetical protein